MATTTTSPHQIVPLHLSGNTTDQQNRMLKQSLEDALETAFAMAIEQLDRQSVQAVLDMVGNQRSRSRKRWWRSFMATL